jgi:tRNA dimethylallyltransferase
VSLAERARLIVVLGSTGVGKSDLALALAPLLDAEIVGCDAFQVYREFDIGTAKPTPAERARVPHHLVDVQDPCVSFTLGEYVSRADAAIRAIHGRGRVPIVVGGTGLYLRGLLRGVLELPTFDPATRARLRGILSRGGAERLHRWLTRVDPASAARIAAHDTARILRAVELACAGDGLWSERLRSEGTWRSGSERYPTLKIGLRVDRPELNSRLDRRVDRFFEAGWVDEVRRLAIGRPTDVGAFRAIGYREIRLCLEQGRDPEEAREAIKRKTRRYAKRQNTWFRRESDVTWIDAEVPMAQRVDRVVQLWRKRDVV